VVHRGFGFGEGGASAADLGDDLLGGLVPDERLGIVVPVFDPEANAFDESVEPVERATPAISQTDH